MNKEELKKGIEVVFDDVAERYDSNRFFWISAEAMMKHISHDEVHTALDLSTGTGTVAISLAKRYRTISIEGIDISTRMLTQARRNASQLDLNNIRFCRMDAEELAYPDSTFDLITCGYGMFFYPNIQETFPLIFQKLKKNGRLLFSTFTEDAFSPYADEFLDLLPDYGIEAPEISRSHLQNKEQIYELCSMVQAEGIKVRKEKIRYKISIDEWWNILNNAGYKGLLNQLPSDRVSEFKQRHLSQVRNLANGDDFCLNADSLFTRVIK